MWQCREAVHARHRQVEQNEAGAQLAGLDDCLLAVRRLPDDVEAMLDEERGQRLAREWVVVPIRMLSICPSSAAGVLPIRGRGSSCFRRYRSWLVGELVLIGVLSLGTIAFAATGRLDGYAFANARIALDMAVAVVASFVAILAATRFLVDGRGMDLLLAGGFLATGVGTFSFAVAPSSPAVGSTRRRAGPRSGPASSAGP